MIVSIYCPKNWFSFTSDSLYPHNQTVSIVLFITGKAISRYNVWIQSHVQAKSYFISSKMLLLTAVSVPILLTILVKCEMNHMFSRLSSSTWKKKKKTTQSIRECLHWVCIALNMQCVCFVGWIYFFAVRCSVYRGTDCDAHIKSLNLVVVVAILCSRVVLLLVDFAFVVGAYET